jgi:glycosyltransferase involved in cell wall biosynthesis
VADVAVLVPTVNRADMLEAVVQSIHDCTMNSHHVYLIMEASDKESRAVARRLKARSVVGFYGSNATAVNAGYWASVEPFVAIVNDDCRFTPGWDVTALSYMSYTTHIVGINQGDGRCTSFSMVRRKYIEEHSGVYDQPNTLYHPYLSQFPDTEFAEYAQHRGVWADAPDSVIEHLHWVFGKGDAYHPNYVKARDTFAADQAVYEERRRQWVA